MQVSFERSGGFIGAPMTITLDSATLAPDDATQLRRLVEAADFFNLPATAKSPAQPDRFHYQVSIQEGDRHHTITIGEAAVSKTLRPLLDWLMDAIRNRKQS